MFTVRPEGFNSEVRGLLEAAGLPVSDLERGVPVALFGVREEERLVGIVGVEVHRNVGLLRSLAVTPEAAGSGIGRALVEAAEAWASDSGLEALYLLTTTASGWFEQRGYAALPRTSAPPGISDSAEFRSLCPDTAVFMGKRLTS